VRAHVKILFFIENEKLRRFLSQKKSDPEDERDDSGFRLVKLMMTTTTKRNASEKSRGFHRDWNGIKGHSSMQCNISE